MRAWHCREIKAAPPTSCRIWTFNTDVHTVHTKIEVLFSESPDGHRASAQIVFYSLSCFPRSKRDGEGCCLPGMILLPLLCNTVTYTLLDRLLWIVVINLIFSWACFVHQGRDRGQWLVTAWKAKMVLFTSFRGTSVALMMFFGGRWYFE